MLPQEIKDGDFMVIDSKEDMQLDYRASRGRGRPRKSLEGAELSLQSAPSTGKRRGRPPGKYQNYTLFADLHGTPSILCCMVQNLRVARPHLEI